MQRGEAGEQTGVEPDAQHRLTAQQVQGGEMLGDRATESDPQLRRGTGQGADQAQPGQVVHGTARTDSAGDAIRAGAGAVTFQHQAEPVTLSGVRLAIPGLGGTRRPSADPDGEPRRRITKKTSGHAMAFADQAGGIHGLNAERTGWAWAEATRAS